MPPTSSSWRSPRLFTDLVKGVVADFDADRGLGTVVEDDGSSHLFHCTVIADGTRSIEAGTNVEFELRPGGPGRWEAFAVTPC